jgi:Zn-dependent protease with chaperone function
MATSRVWILVPPPSDPAIAVYGRAFPPGRSAALEMRLRRRGDRVDLLDASGTPWRSEPLDAIRVDAPLGRLRRKATFPDGTVFETDQSAPFDDVLGRHAVHGLHAAEAFRPRLIAIVAGCLLGAALVWRLALPALVALAIWMTPPALLREVDRGQLAVFDGTLLDPSELSRERRAEIAAIHRELLAHVPSRRLPSTELRFRSTPLGPNAFAMPGGTVVVTDDLAQMLADDPDAMAGVLAHELIHVADRHGLKALYRSLAIYALIALAAGETGPILDEMLLEGNVLLALRGSRTAESEADGGGVALMRAAGFDPEGLARFFDRLAAMPGAEGGWLSTHPGSADRAAAIRASSP